MPRPAVRKAFSTILCSSLNDKVLSNAVKIAIVYKLAVTFCLVTMKPFSVKPFSVELQAFRFYILYVIWLPRRVDVICHFPQFVESINLNLLIWNLNLNIYIFLNEIINTSPKNFKYQILLILLLCLILWFKFFILTTFTESRKRLW